MNKSQVLRKGLEHIFDSVRICKTMVELEDEEDAQIFIHRVVKHCPLHVSYQLDRVHRDDS